MVTGGTNGEGVTVGGTFTIRGVVFDYGSFITAVINFLIMAFVLFLLVKAMNKMMSLGKKKEEPAPTTRIVHTASARYLLRQQDVLSVQQNSR